MPEVSSSIYIVVTIGYRFLPILNSYFLGNWILIDRKIVSHLPFWGVEKGRVRNLDAGYWILDTGCRILDVGCSEMGKEGSIVVGGCR